MGFEPARNMRKSKPFTDASLLAPPPTPPPRSLVPITAQLRTYGAPYFHLTYVDNYEFAESLATMYHPEAVGNTIGRDR